MSNVIILDTLTTLPIPPDRVLEAAVGELDSVIILGIDKDGEEYFATSNTDKYEMLWLLERFKDTLLREDA